MTNRPEGQNLLAGSGVTLLVGRGQTAEPPAESGSQALGDLLAASAVLGGQQVAKASVATGWCQIPSR